jgi:hypothetical protein
MGLLPSTELLDQAGSLGAADLGGTVGTSFGLAMKSASDSFMVPLALPPEGDGLGSVYSG